MKIEALNESGYTTLICRYFEQRFPKVFNPTKENILEILSEIIIGTKENRYGPVPSVENQVAIRNVIRQAVERNEPIPILIPWGGVKPNMSGLDIAEVAGINQILTLDALVKNYYEPGIHANIRIEDTGALWLYRDDDDAFEKINDYSVNFTKLVHILKHDSRINPLMESLVMDVGNYFSKSAYFSDLLMDYILSTDFEGTRLGTGSAFEKLAKAGWKGVIPIEQRNYYRGLYKSRDNNLDEMAATRMLADYLGGSKARYDLNGSMKPNTSYGYIQMAFVSPIPGAPVDMFNTSVYWRTVPMSEGKTHIAPWRAKGYLAINGDKVKSKVTSFGNTELINSLEHDTFVISHDNRQVKIQTDYLIEV
jgi:hypothetical protein